MSFLRHRQIYRSDITLDRRRSPVGLRSRGHRLDEFAASYSLAGCSPAAPASALPAGSIVNRQAEAVNHYLRLVVYSSTGTMVCFSSGIDMGGVRSGRLAKTMPIKSP